MNSSVEEEGGEFRKYIHYQRRRRRKDASLAASYPDFGLGDGLIGVALRRRIAAIMHWLPRMP